MNTQSSYNNRLEQAKSLYTQGQYQEALEIFQSLRKEYPNESQPVAGEGICLFAMDERTQALGCFIEAANIEPEKVENHVNIAHCLNTLGQERMAISQYDKALKLDENNLLALSELGRLYLDRHRNIEAAEILKKAVNIKASNAPNQANLGLALANIGNFEEAIKHANKAIRLESKNSFVYYVMGQIHLMHGNQTEAENFFNKTIEMDPSYGHAYYALVSKKITKDDRALIKKMESALNQGMPPDSRKLFLFALGKAYDDIKQIDKAFMYTHKANELNNLDFDAKSNNRAVRRVKKFFSKQFFSNLQYHSTAPYKPIFIVGMPRSGSTLIDQILSSHSSVYSGGESMALDDTVYEIKDDIGNKLGYPECLNELDQKLIEKYSNAYIEKIEQGTKNATHIVDKNLFNYRHLGLIAILFPDAKIIHTRRHPLDIGLSCYMTGFSAALEWTDNLESIGKYYRSYVDLMEHWHNTLPIQILDVKYAEMVSDPEKNVRRILEYCGLEWEDACLEFYKSKRSVNTASLWQVRQPVYKSSLQRWVPYAKHLQPLILALGDLLEADYEKLESMGLKHGPRHNNPLNKISKLFR